jgi:enoyl-CoA hydratase
VPDGRSRATAEELAARIAAFPQSCVRVDRRSAIAQYGLPERQALEQEWANGRPELAKCGIKGAGLFRDGAGRHGEFGRKA